MTKAQTLRLDGFNASLAERGVGLKVSPDGPTFMALVEMIEPPAGQFEVGNDVERESSRVHLLRTDKPDGFVVGAALYDADADRFHRIQAIRDHPTSIAIVATCETSEP